MEDQLSLPVVPISKRKQSRFLRQAVYLDRDREPEEVRKAKAAIRKARRSHPRNQQ
jgi:hypothetical protein